jgi:hypothetical protein
MLTMKKYVGAVVLRCDLELMTLEHMKKNFVMMLVELEIKDVEIKKEKVKMKKNRKYFLDEAEKLINGPRAKEYGPAKFNHERIAKIWSVILAREVTAQEVVACMVGVKLARLAETIEHDDSWVDIIGYAALGGEIINDK